MADIEKGKVHSEEDESDNAKVTKVYNENDDSGSYTVEVSGDEETLDYNIIVPEEINQRRFKN